MSTVYPFSNISGVYAFSASTSSSNTAVQILPLSGTPPYQDYLIENQGEVVVYVILAASQAVANAMTVPSVGVPGTGIPVLPGSSIILPGPYQAWFNAQSAVSTANLVVCGGIGNLSAFGTSSTNGGVPGGGTVTAVDVSGGTTGLTTSGGPVTNAGTITLAGTLALTNGGTGATTAAGARANLGLTASTGAGLIGSNDGWSTVQASLNARMQRVSLYSDLQAISPTNAALAPTASVMGRTSVPDGGMGIFDWLTGDQSAKVTSDSGLGIYVPPSSDLTGASGVWQRRVSDTYSPSWWNTGSTTATNATAITNALAYLGNIGGGTLTVNGIWDVGNNNFTVPSNTTIRGNGATIKKSSNSTNARIFVIRNVSNVRIEEFATLDGNYTGAATGSNPVIEIGDLTAGTSGMLTSNVWIVNNYIKNGNHSCVGIYGETDTGVAGNKDIYVLGNKLERAGTGVFVYKGGDGIHVEGNTMRNIGSVGVVHDTRAATDANTSGVYPIINSSIKNNIMIGIGGDVGFQGTGMTLKGALENLTVTGNEIRSVTSDAVRNTYGILVAQSAGAGTAPTVTPNIVGGAITSYTINTAGSGLTKVPVFFISSGTGSGATATGTLSGGTLATITPVTNGQGYVNAYVQCVVGDVPRNILIADNIIDTVGDTGGTLGWPIYVQSASQDITVENNQIKNCKRGITLDAPDSVTILGNTIRDCPTGGTSLFPIQVAGVSATAKATNVTIDRNTIILGSGNSATSAGVSLNFTERVLLGENNINGGFTNKYSISATNAGLTSGAIGSATYDPPSLATGAGVTATVTCNGAEAGDIVDVGFTTPLQGILINPSVSSANTIQVRFQNQTGGTLDLASGTLSVKQRKP